VAERPCFIRALYELATPEAEDEEDQDQEQDERQIGTFADPCHWSNSLLLESLA
jgi:hypothetical protein